MLVLTSVRMQLRHSGREVGTTLIEATVATAICAIFLGSIFTVNTGSMQTVKMSREAASASQILQQRVESLRIANWHQVTDATWLKNNLLNTAAPGSSALRNLSEQITLVPYGSSTAGNMQLTCSNGTVSIISSQSLLAESAVKVIWTVTYIGAPNNRTTTRQLVGILAKGGVAK
jgi:type II secretory pathway pseudopilin PulG